MALNMSEKTKLASRIERGMTVIGTAIAQLYLASPNEQAPANNEILVVLSKLPPRTWKFTNIEGALLFVQDPSGNCYFRMYDLSSYEKRFEYELYDNMDYVRLSPNFHAFEMEDCVCGLNFSSSEVSTRFLGKVRNFQPKSDDSQAHVPQPKRTTVQSQPKSRPVASSFAADNNGKRQSQDEQREPYLKNGLIDARNIPSSWKKILRQAGIRKKDLKDPNMINIIRNALEQNGIAFDPPPLDFDDAEIRRHFSPEEQRAYETYKREMEQYNAEVARYEAEKAQYENFQETNDLLDRHVEQFKANNNLVDDAGQDRLRQSVMMFQQKNIQNLMPQAIQQYEQMQEPRMSVAMPKVPALPVIPKKRPAQAQERMQEQRVPQKSGVGNRVTNMFKKKKRATREPAKSKMVERPLPVPKASFFEEEEQAPALPPRQAEPKKETPKPKFLMDIALGTQQLKHTERPTSVLPDLSNLHDGKADGILDLLRKNLQAHREKLKEDESDGEASDFSDITDFD